MLSHLLRQASCTEDLESTGDSGADPGFGVEGGGEFGKVI